MFNKIRKLDNKKETEGVWFDFDEEISFKIAKHENPNWALEMLVLLKPYQQKLQRGKELEPSVYSDILNKVTAKTILKDWKGLEEEFTYENAVTLLKDESLKHVKEFILEKSQNLANYYADRVSEGVDTAKNS